MSTLSEPTTAPVASKARWTRLWVALAAMVTAAAVVRGLASRAPEEAPNKAKNSASPTPTDMTQWPAIRVATATTPAERWTPPYPARLRVNENAASRICSPASGRVTHVFVELGDRVRAGDKLFSVSSPAVAQLRAEQQRAVVDLEAATTSLARIAAMVEARTLAGKEEITAQARVRQARVTLKLANAKLSALRVPRAQNADFTVVAPRDGAVVTKSVVPSQSVKAGDTLVEVADVNTVSAVAEVFEMDIGGIHPGAAVRLTSPTMPGWFLTTTVQTVTAILDPRRRTTSVRALVPNQDLRLRANTYVEMSVRELVPPRSVEVPLSALVSNGGAPYVYIRDDAGRFVRRAVRTTLGRSSLVLVTEGLLAGDVVAKEGLALIENRICLGLDQSALN